MDSMSDKEKLRMENKIKEYIGKQSSECKEVIESSWWKGEDIEIWRE